MFRSRIRRWVFCILMGMGWLLTCLPALGDEENKSPYRYICGCAMAVGCQLSYDHPGTCPCGKPLFKKTIVKEDDHYYYITRSAKPDCQCSKDPDDSNKCICGKDLYALKKKPSQSFQCFKDGGCEGKDAPHDTTPDTPE